MKRKFLLMLALWLSLVGCLWAEPNCLHFNFSYDNYVSCPAINPTNFTVEAWVRPGALYMEQRIISTLNDGDYTGMELRIESDCYPSVIIGNGSNFITVKGTTRLKIAEWVHYAATYNGTNLNLYINGVLVGSQSVSSYNAGSNTLTIGRRSVATSVVQYGGWIDEVRVWNTARTESAIASTMNTSPVGTESGLMAFYDFNQGKAAGANSSETTLIDRTSNGKNGTLNGFTFDGIYSNWVTGYIIPLLSSTFVSQNSGNLSFTAKASASGIGYVDWGDGSLVEYSIPANTDASYSTSSYIAGNTVKVYMAGMFSLNVKGQNITSIDLSGNSTLAELNFKDNQLDFTTLPQPKTSYTSYLYAPQASIAAKSIIGVVDLSELLSATDVNGAKQTTEYKWYLIDGTQLSSGVDYIEQNGLFTFTDQPASDVYCTMTNAAFPDFSGGNTLNTDQMSIDAVQEPKITFVSNNNGLLDLWISAFDNRDIYVDWGNGSPKTYSITTDGSHVKTTSYVAGNTVKIYGENFKEFNNSSCGVTTLDVSNCTGLKYLLSGRNSLTTLDLSNNLNLDLIYLLENKLTQIVINKNNVLTRLYCEKNNLSISTLPKRKTSQTYYSYVPQSNYVATCTNGVVDLSSELTALDRNDVVQTTTYTWFNADGSEMTPNVDYCEDNGVFMFIKQPTSTIYCVMVNAAFPDLSFSSIRTNNLTVDKVCNPNITLVSENTGDLSFYVQWNGTGENIAYVDWGNGELLSYTDNNISTNSYTAGNTVKVYGVRISYFDAAAKGLTALDLSNISTLTTLYCDQNKLSSLDVSQSSGLTYLSCHDNNLGSLNVSQNTELTYLSCYANNISSLNVDQNTKLTMLDCSDNDLTSLNVSQNTSLEELFCAGNQLNFATLPQVKASYSDYSFAPQQNLVATCANGVVDLSSQLTALGYIGTTTYTWYLSNNTQLSKNFMEEDGVFRFVAEPGTVVYCRMTNPAFPNLTLRTTDITIDAVATLPAPDIAMVSENNGDLNFMLQSNSQKRVYVYWGGNSMNIYDDAFGGTNPSTTTYAAGDTIKVFGEGIIQLDVNNKGLTALEVSHSDSLNDLNCSTNKIGILNVSQNTRLTNLNCYTNSLGSLDVSSNTLLSYLDCSFNNLSSLDVSQNTGLTDLSCGNNHLQSLDVSYNTKLENLYCSGNQFTFQSLPKWTNFLYYEFDPQDSITATCTNGVVDLSDQLKVIDAYGDTTTTEYTWYLADGTQLRNNYMEKDGVFRFVAEPGTKVYGEMTNNIFSGLALRTKCITIDSKATLPEPDLTFVSENTGDLTLYLDCTEDGMVYVDWGDGNLMNSEVYHNYMNDLSTSGYVANSTVKIYNPNITDISAYNNGITVLDITKVTKLTQLECYGNKLRNLNVSNNTLLTVLSAYNNELAELDVTNNTLLTELTVYSNKLNQLNVNQNTELTYLDCDENNLGALDVQNNTKLTDLYCSDNNLSILDVQNNTELFRLNCYGNKLTFASLPQPNSNFSDYYYEPQDTLAATCAGGMVDLSAQLTALDIDTITQTTVYTWYYTTGGTLTAGTEFEETDGVFTFYSELSDSVYCTMTNDAFPGLELRTQNLKITLCANPTDGGEIEGNQSICFGSTPMVIVNAGLPNNAYGTTEYKWQVSTENDSTGFTDIASSNSQSYAPAALSSTTWYKRIARVSCMSDWTNAAESNVVEVVVNALPDAPTEPANQNTYTYDGVAKTATGVVSASDTIYWFDAQTAGNSIAAPTATNVGTYTAWAETRNKTTGCISETRTQLSLKIEKATLTVTADNQTKVYGTANPTLTYQYSGWVNGVETIDTPPTISTTVNTLSNAGSYPDSITLTGGLDNNYLFSFVAGDFTITKATLIATADNQTKVYGQANPTLTYQYSGWVNGIETIDTPPVIATTVDEWSNAGTYADSITLTGGLDNNYLFSFVAGDFTITKATVTVTANNQTKVYGDTIPELTYYYAGFVNNEDSTVIDTEPAISTTVDTLSDAGLYPGSITFTGGMDNNYLFSFVPGDFTVTKATLNATADNQTKVYGSMNPVLTITYSGWVNGDGIKDLDAEPTASTYVDELSNAGFYADAITLSGGLDNNYNFTLIPGDFTVSKAILTVKANSQSKVYGGRNPYNTFYYKGWVNGVEDIDVEPVMTTYVDQYTPAGMYSSAILISGASDNNYDFNYIPGTYRITQAPLTVTVNTVTRPYGSDNPEYTFSFSGWLNNDSTVEFLPDVITDIDRYTVVGEYAGALHLSGGHDNNYLFTRIDGDINVVPAVLEARAVDKQVIYGQPIPAMDVQISGFVNDESESILDVLPHASTTASSLSEPGDYPITVSGGAGPNYVFEYSNGTLTISDKQVPVITWSTPGSIVYGTALSEAQLNAVASVPGSFSYTPDMGNVPTAGENQCLTVTFTPNDQDNYQATSKSVFIKVLPAMLTVTANDQSVKTGQSIPELTYMIEGFVNNDDVTALSKLPQATTQANSNSSVGTYPIAISGAVASNYAFTYVGGTLTIGEKQLPVITWKQPGSIGYGTALSAAQLNAATTIPGSFSYSPGMGSVLKVGKSQKLSVTFTPDDQVNYQTASMSVSIDVMTAVLTVTANNLEITYGDALPALTYTVTGFVNGNSLDDLDLKPGAEISYDERLNAGTYTIKTKGGVSANYAFDYHEGTLTVNKATLKVTPANITIKEGESIPDFSLTYEGFKYNDSPSDIDQLPSVTSIVYSMIPAGVYELVPAGGSDNNYTFVYVNGVLTIEEKVSADQIASISISAYPNPFSEGLNIKTTSSEDGSYTVSNLSGQVLRQGELKGSLTHVGMADLRNGVYLINIKVNNQTQILRVVKQ